MIKNWHQKAAASSVSGVDTRFVIDCSDMLGRLLSGEQITFFAAVMVLEQKRQDNRKWDIICCCTSTTEKDAGYFCGAFAGMHSEGCSSPSHSLQLMYVPRCRNACLFSRIAVEPLLQHSAVHRILLQTEYALQWRSSTIKSFPDSYQHSGSSDGTPHLFDRGNHILYVVLWLRSAFNFA